MPSRWMASGRYLHLGCAYRIIREKWFLLEVLVDSWQTISAAYMKICSVNETVTKQSWMKYTQIICMIIVRFMIV